MTARADGILNVLINTSDADAGLSQLQDSVGKAATSFKSGHMSLHSFTEGLDDVSILAAEARQAIGGNLVDGLHQFWGVASEIGAGFYTGGLVGGGIATVTALGTEMIKMWEQSKKEALAFSKAGGKQLADALLKIEKRVIANAKAAENWEEKIRFFGMTAAQIAVAQAELEKSSIAITQDHLDTATARKERQLATMRAELADVEQSMRSSRRNENFQADKERADLLKQKIKTDQEIVDSFTERRAKLDEESAQATRKAAAAQKFQNMMDRDSIKTKKKKTKAIDDEADAGDRLSRVLKNARFVRALERANEAEDDRIIAEMYWDEWDRQRKRNEREEEAARKREMEKRRKWYKDVAEMREKEREEALEKEKEALQTKEDWWREFAQEIGNTFLEVADIGLDALEKLAAGEEVELDKIAAGFLRAQGTQVMGIGISTIAAGVGKLVTFGPPAGITGIAVGGTMTALGLAMGGAGAVWSGRIQALANRGGLEESDLGLATQATDIDAGAFASGANTGPTIYNFNFTSSTVVGNPNESAMFISKRAHQAEQEQFARL